jgi:hypothetical protein
MTRRCEADPVFTWDGRRLPVGKLTAGTGCRSLIPTCVVTDTRSLKD